ncbi:MAG: MraY family glycosyltransferase [Patescibacteria group bacterium]|jgi:UDP-GlcNAc:undecaprenyl-phosphate GlcNAc-1-phosphate transferase
MPVWFPLPIALAFVVSASVTPLVILLATKFGLVDEPTGGRKIHRVSTPLLGGAAVFLGFFVPTVLVLGFSNHLTSGEIDLTQYLGFFAAALMLMIGGALDDKLGLSPKYSVWFPVLAALIASLVGIGVSKLTNPVGDAIIVSSMASAIITFVWLLVMSYATKLLDGVDGLTTSVATIASLMIAALALTKMYFQPDVVLLALMFVAALVGFLLWNLPVARIFLGEGGSTFLGFTLGVLSIIAGSKMVTLLLVLGVPCLDVIQVMYRRLREHRSITSGDRYHFHHLLFDAGLSEWQVVAVYASFSLLFGLTTLFFSHLIKLVILAGLVFLFMGVVRTLARRSQAL